MYTGKKKMSTHNRKLRIYIVGFLGILLIFSGSIVSGKEIPTITLSEKEFTVFKIEITHIKFDHMSGDSNDGIDIRENYSLDISVPEWVKGGQNKPAAYKKNIGITIKARFTVQPSSIKSARIRAVSIDGDGSLGDIEEVVVNFSSGVSDPEYITFAVMGTTPNIVEKTSTDLWQWKVKDVDNSGSPESDINITGPHTIYTLLGAPQSPMTEPWTEILDYACVWANGQIDEAGIARDITVNAYTNFGKDYNGEITHALGTFFDLTSFLADSKADCRDMSATVQIFTRALGGIFTNVRMINDPSPLIEDFIYKSIDPVGSPSWQTGTWSFHQVANYLGVYDAALRVNPSIPRIPSGEDINGSYKNDLFESGEWVPKTPFSYTIIY